MGDPCKCRDVPTLGQFPLHFTPRNNFLGPQNPGRTSSMQQRWLPTKQVRAAFRSREKVPHTAMGDPRCRHEAAKPGPYSRLPVIGSNSVPPRSRGCTPIPESTNGVCIGPTSHQFCCTVLLLRYVLWLSAPLYHSPHQRERHLAVHPCKLQAQHPGQRTEQMEHHRSILL